MLKKFHVGDPINIIGRLREYNNERYIIPEIVKKVDDPHWELVRKLELLKLYGKPNKIEKRQDVVLSEEVIEEVNNKREFLINLIGKFDDGEGVNVEKVIEASGLVRDDVEKVIVELLKEGEIFEIKPGILKII